MFAAGSFSVLREKRTPHLGYWVEKRNPEPGDHRKEEDPQVSLGRQTFIRQPSGFRGVRELEQ